MLSTSTSASLIQIARGILHPALRIIARELLAGAFFVLCCVRCFSLSWFNLLFYYFRLGIIINGVAHHLPWHHTQPPIEWTLFAIRRMWTDSTHKTRTWPRPLDQVWGKRYFRAQHIEYSNYYPQKEKNEKLSRNTQKTGDNIEYGALAVCNTLDILL